MRPIIYLLMLFVLFFLTPVSAAESEVKVIAAYEEDVTGDGKTEQIDLKGIFFSPEGMYYQDIFTTITSDTEAWRLNYQGGYDPELQFVDLNHDGIVDIFYQSATGGSGGLYHSQLDTLAGGNVTNIFEFTRK